MLNIILNVKNIINNSFRFRNINWLTEVNASFGVGGSISIIVPPPKSKGFKLT